MADALEPRPLWLSRLLIAGFMLMALGYTTNIPLWEAPDETGHFLFVQHLRQTAALPEMAVGKLDESHQPPLYYVLAALISLPANLNSNQPLFFPNPNFTFAGGDEVNISIHRSFETFPYEDAVLAFHLARLASVLMGAGTVFLTVRLGWLLFPERPVVGLTAGVLVAFNPQFLFLSGVLNNDNLFNLAAAGCWYQLVCTLKDQENIKAWIFLGLWLSAAVLAKLSGLAVGLIVVLILVAVMVKTGAFRPILRGSVVTGVTVSLLAGWWYVRNQLLYGDPFGLTLFRQVYAVNGRTIPLSVEEIGRYMTIQFRSFWAMFGWVNVPAPTWYYTFLVFFCLVCAGGLIWFVFRPSFKMGSKYNILYLGAAVIGFYGYLFVFIADCNDSCYQGRYLMGVIGPLMLLLVLGFGQVRPPIIQSRLWFGGLMFLWLGLAVLMITNVIRPAYQTPTAAKWHLWLVDNQLELPIGQFFVLHGYDVEQSDEAVTLSLYWQATQIPDFDYTTFVHLIDGNGQVITQHDYSPGEPAGFLPTQWQPQDIVMAEHQLQLPVTASGSYQFRIGMYNWMTGEQLLIQTADGSQQPFIVLDEVILRE